jgi:ABC-type sugar transport system ATPase subunit
MIYVTHDQVEAMTLADRIVVLKDGRIEQVGTPLELYNTPRAICSSPASSARRR